jgi:alpha-tubulin suppressor-like RCC1 family protein
MGQVLHDHGTVAPANLVPAAHWVSACRDYPSNIPRTVECGQSDPELAGRLLKALWRMRQAKEDLTMPTYSRKQTSFPLPFGLLLAAASVVHLAGCAMPADGASVGEEQEAQQKPPGGFGGSPGFSINMAALVDVSAGAYHTCVRRLDGRMYCWGFDSSGQVGASNATCFGYPCATQPLYVGTAKQMSLGYNHTCTLDTAGHAYCFGAGNSGQLALGNGLTATSGSNGPIQDINGVPLTFSSISAGGNSVCGVFAGSGSLYCWGVVMHDPSLGYSMFPVPFLTAPGIVPTGMSAVATGNATACMGWPLTGGGLQTQCFSGRDQYGASTYFGGFGTSAKRMASQNDFVCADMLNGTVQCFGNDSVGQLGDGVSGVSNPTPQPVGGGMALHGVTTGVYHACALDPFGNAYCWGLGGWNQLGQGSIGGTVSDSSVPVAVNAGGVKFSALAAGGYHTCGIGMNGHIYCWGNNQYGQMGIGFSQPSQGATVFLQAVDPAP